MIPSTNLESPLWQGLSQGLSHDFKNACPKQQFQKFCLSRFSYLSTSNPYTSYILRPSLSKWTIYTSAMS